VEGCSTPVVNGGDVPACPIESETEKCLRENNDVL
jgi:hypothetical protein